MLCLYVSLIFFLCLSDGAFNNDAKRNKILISFSPKVHTSRKKIQEKFWQIYSNELEILKKNYKNSFIHENHKNFFSAISVEFVKKNEYLIS